MVKGPVGPITNKMAEVMAEEISAAGLDKFDSRIPGRNREVELITYP